MRLAQESWIRKNFVSVAEVAKTFVEPFFLPVYFMQTSRQRQRTRVELSYGKKEVWRVEGIVLNSFGGCADTGIEDNSRHELQHKRRKSAFSAVRQSYSRNMELDSASNRLINSHHGYTKI